MNATTELTLPNTTDSMAYSQSINIVDKKNRHFFPIQLDRHRSRSSRTPGSWLDSIASSASCFHSKFGHDYLILDFACWNREALTCNTATDDPASEWQQVYDSRARPLTGGRNATDRDREKLDKIGLEFRFLQRPRNEVDFW